MCGNKVVESSAGGLDDDAAIELSDVLPLEHSGFFPVVIEEVFKPLKVFAAWGWQRWTHLVSVLMCLHSPLPVVYSVG